MYKWSFSIPISTLCEKQRSERGRNQSSLLQLVMCFDTRDEMACAVIEPYMFEHDMLYDSANFKSIHFRRVENYYLHFKLGSCVYFFVFFVEQPLICLNIKNILILHFMTPLKATGQIQNDPCTTFHKTKHQALLFACKHISEIFLLKCQVWYEWYFYFL